MKHPTTRREFLRTSLLAVPVLGWPGFRSLELDLVLKGGRVVDGTGAPAFVADVGIAGGHITSIGDLGEKAGRVIDARGMIVAPGFIDVHAHTDLRRNPRAQSKLYQGVTLDVTGPDGGSPFPVRRGAAAGDAVKDVAQCTSGRLWAEQHDGIAINVRSYVGHATVRQLVLGSMNRKPDERELRLMQDLVRQAMKEGALGLSSGLEYFPGGFADTAELIALAKIAAELDRPYVTHMRNEDDRLLEAVDEAIDICRRSGAPLLISHMKVGGKPNWHKIDALLERIDKARGAGLEVRADRYPYDAWSTGLAINFPGWAKEGGKFVTRLKDPAERARMKAETEDTVAANGGWGVLMIAGGVRGEDRQLLGKRVDEVARERGVDSFELACDLLTRGSVSILGFAMSEENMDRILSQPYCMVASDGSAVPASGRTGHPRSFGTFPRAFRRYVREEKLLSLEEMVRKMTSLPATTLRLADRGVLAKGKVADVVVFDPDTYADRATYLEPQQYAEGVSHLLVNGELAIEDGKQTAAMAGRANPG